MLEQEKMLIEFKKPKDLPKIENYEVIDITTKNENEMEVEVEVLVEQQPEEAEEVPQSESEA